MTRKIYKVEASTHVITYCRASLPSRRKMIRLVDMTQTIEQSLPAFVLYYEMEY